jgi:hypothetical protein
VQSGFGLNAFSIPAMVEPSRWSFVDSVRTEQRFDS